MKTQNISYAQVAAAAGTTIQAARVMIDHIQKGQASPESVAHLEANLGSEKLQAAVSYLGR